MDRLNFDKLKVFAAATTLAMFAGVACAEHEVQLYGEVNRAFLGIDDGYNRPGFFVDNAFANSGLGVKGHAHVNRCVTVGGVLESMFAPASSLQVNQIGAVDQEDTNPVTVTMADVWMAHSGLWGKVTLGYGDAASAKITQMSYSRAGTTVSSSLVASPAGGMLLQRNIAGSTGGDANISVFDAFSTPDGIGSNDPTGRFRQQNRVRWDSGRWYGLSLAVSHGKVNDRDLHATNFGNVSSAIATGLNRSFTDVALRYEEKWDDFLVSAGVAWAKQSRNGILAEQFATQVKSQTGVTLPAATARGQRFWGGSVAVEHVPTGINAAVAYSNKRKNTSALSNQSVWFVQLGKHFCFWHFGKTNLVLDYFSGKKTLLNTDKSQSWGVGVVQELHKVNSEVYASVRGYKYKPGDLTSYTFKTMTVGFVGMRFKFGAML